MHNKRRHFIRACAASTLLAGIASPWQRAWAARQKVRYGGSAWLGHYPAYLAMNDGSLGAQGIDQEWQSFGTSSSRMSAVLSGDIDIACTGIVSALALMARDVRQFSIIAIPENFGRVEGILARDNIKNVQDLKGKKLGVTFASSAHLLVLDVIARAGLKASDVSVLNVPAPELPAAMQSGHIDAAAAWTPQFDAIRRRPGVSLLADDTHFSLYQSHKVTPGPDVLIARKAFIEKNADTIKPYLQAYFKASGTLRDSPQEAARTLTQLTKLTAEEQIAAIKGADWYSQAQQAELLKGAYIDGLQKLAELLVEHKQIDKAPQVRQWIDPSFV